MMTIMMMMQLARSFYYNNLSECVCVCGSLLCSLSLAHSHIPRVVALARTRTAQPTIKVNIGMIFRCHHMTFMWLRGIGKLERKRMNQSTGYFGIVADFKLFYFEVKRLHLCKNKF